MIEIDNVWPSSIEDGLEMRYDSESLEVSLITTEDVSPTCWVRLESEKNLISRVSFPSVFLSLLREIEAVLERPFSALIDPVAPKRKSSESIPVPDVDQ